jgi:hypothetical protein
MRDYNLPALRTLGGAINYTLRRYNQKTVNEESRDWQLLASFLGVSVNDVPEVQLTADGFRVECARKKNDLS